VRGLARGLNIFGGTPSPTFTLVREYGALVHVDLYRLDVNEAAALGWEDLLDSERIVVIEWSSHLPHGFWAGTAPLFKLHFEILGEVRRRITLTCGNSVRPELREKVEVSFCG
jgi:tRNA A37 threonylcarbamoyladenosine biosynthesis protein TsaE